MTAEPHTHDQGPKGRASEPTPSGWIRRRALPLAARLTALAGVALLGGWVTGRIVTDEYAWSQYLWWVPTLWIVAPAAVLWAVSAIAAKLATRLGGLFLRPVLLLGLIGAVAWFGIVECRLVRLSASAPGNATPIRIVSWNMASNGMWREAGDWVSDMNPDVVLLANTPRTKTRAEIMPGFERVLEDERQAEKYTEDGPITVSTRSVSIGRFEVYSRLPVLRAGSAYVPLPKDATQGWRAERVPAQMTFIELDATERGIPEPIVIWLVDLPSTPGLHRMESMQTAAEAAREWYGNEMVPNGRGGLVMLRLEDSDNPQRPYGFPQANIVIGDFNTPRGSASIDLLLDAAAGDGKPLRDAHAQAGVGPDWTWTPRFKLVPDRPWWAIDLAYVGSALRAIRYDAVKPPATGRERHDHAAVVVELVPDR